MTRLEYYIIKSKPVQATIHWLKRVHPAGFEGVSLYDSLNFFRKEIFSNRFYSKASAISFSFLMAMPPLLLFFFTLVPYLPLPEQKIIKMINDTLFMISSNENLQRSVSKVLSDFITHKKNVLLSFSVLLTIYYSSNGVMGLMNTFEKQIPGFRQRHWLKQRLIAILLTLLIILAVLATMTIMLIQTWVTAKLGSDFLNNALFLKVIAYLLLMGMSLLIVAFIYKYGTPTESKFRLFSPGAIIATFLMVVLTAIFFYSVNNLVNYDKIYGSIGTLIIFMVWINFMAQILLIGFELNASIIFHRKGKPLKHVTKQKDIEA
ncbi:MAG: YihY/virulence factor BrkB family protein [Chitinophagaceae bacterium]|nr:YihY/virulence factor BrkB family protein [Chitinophagaceae bacterium]